MQRQAQSAGGKAIESFQVGSTCSDWVRLRGGAEKELSCGSKWDSWRWQRQIMAPGKITGSWGCGWVWGAGVVEGYGVRFPEREARTEYRVAFKVRSIGLTEKQKRVQSSQRAETWTPPICQEPWNSSRQRAWVLLVLPPSSAVALPKKCNHKKCFFLYLRVIPKGVLNGFNTGISTSRLWRTPWAVSLGFCRTHPHNLFHTLRMLL